MADFRLWECLVCGFIYDEAKGWPGDGIEPGTRWEDVPSDWLCPECGVGKSDFEMVDIGPSSAGSESISKLESEPKSAPAQPKKDPSPVPAIETSAGLIPEAVGHQKWTCHECGFVYAENDGWLEDGIAPGTSLNDIPSGWTCPDCGAEKSVFTPSVSKTSDRIVVIGTGLAAYNFVREFRKLDNATPIIMITSDDGHFYSKPQISTGYTRQKRADELVTAPAEKMALDLQVDIRVFTEVTEINTRGQFVVANKQPLGYSKLVLAWGASCISLPLQGNGLSDVYQVNDLLDYNRFRTALVGKRKVLVIGAGLIGSEYANDLANGGYEIEAVDPLGGPLATLLPDESSQAVRRGLESLGVKYHFGTVAERIDQHGKGIRATLANGDYIDADIVLSAVGVRPRVELAKDSGIETNRGVMVNRFLETSVKNVYALGDCAEVDGHVLYYLLPLMACARSLALTLGGSPSQVSYGAMPVKVKTPVCPIAVLPPPMGVEGEWAVEQQNNDTKALFHDRNKTLRGFALTGAYSAEANGLADQIPALME